ncbi:amidohydrolase family protein [Orbus mooreae]|uniref:amidohydrolase family protein n=1 Tax=Orbus mooreae TaxID=3074107 RepID=UPI00370DC803
MKKIDTHQHYWHYDSHNYPWIDEQMIELKQNRLPQDSIDYLKQHNITGCIAVQARQSELENQFLLNLAENNHQILGIIGWLDLCQSKATQPLEKWQDNLVMKGYRHLIQDEADPDGFFLNTTFNKHVDLILKQNKVYEVLIHAKNLPSAIQFFYKHDHSIMVLDHLGKPNIAHGNAQEWKKQIAPLVNQKHVVAKLSGLITEAGKNWQSNQIEPYIDIALEVFGPERLMFGSDWPVCLLAGNYSQVYNLIETTINKLSSNEQAAIWGENAKKVYRLD